MSHQSTSCLINPARSIHKDLTRMHPLSLQNSPSISALMRVSNAYTTQVTPGWSASPSIWQSETEICPCSKSCGGSLEISGTASTLVTCVRGASRIAGNMAWMLFFNLSSLSKSIYHLTPKTKPNSWRLRFLTWSLHLRTSQVWVHPLCKPKSF